MTENTNSPTAAKPNILEIDLDAVRPDPEKTQRAHNMSKMLFGTVLAIAFGGIGYIGSRSPRFQINPLSATAVGAVIGAIIGAIIGVIVGSRKETYEEQTYKLISEASQSADASKALQDVLIKKLKQKDREIAMAYSGY